MASFATTGFEVSVLNDVATAPEPVIIVATTPASVSQTTLDLWNQLGPWRDADLASGLAGNGYPLLILVDSIASQFAITEQYTRDDATHVGWGQLLDVNACPTFALPWLAQLAGVTIPVGATDTQMRALITGQANMKRGTVAALITTLQTYLTGTKFVTVTERSPDPYSFVISCLTAEMPGGPSGATAAQALAALIAAKPAGLILSFLVQAGLTWAEMANYPVGTAGTWADQTDTWSSLSSEIPVM